MAQLLKAFRQYMQISTLDFFSNLDRYLDTLDVIEA